MEPAVTDALRRAEEVLRRGYEHLARHCSGDARARAAQLDECQLECFDLAWSSAGLAAARATVDYAARATDALAQPLCNLFVAETLQDLVSRLSIRAADYGLVSTDVESIAPSRVNELAKAASTEQLRRIGNALIEGTAALPRRLLNAEQELIWESFARFAAEVLAPCAQDIHCSDLDIPESVLRAAADIGLFKVSVPCRYGGLQPDEQPDTLAMVVATEALSEVSLGAGGSLITRPEILVRALLAGGTSEQQRHWLPRLASGQTLCAVSITEPDYGSDVASLRLRATRSANAWCLSGTKTWCTFAGRADVLLVLARSDPDLALGHRGLSLFLVEKPPFPGHEFSYRSPAGGRLSGRAISTIGYRGMHSFELFFDDVIVPLDALVGGAEGLGKGFYFAMKGFSGGRLQTAARANGVMLAAFNAALDYARSRKVFGRSLGDYALTQSKIARMAAALTATQQFAYATAARVDSGEGDLEASLVKLFASRIAEWVSREAMQLHGGLGYASESAVSRLFVDARVLSIFEGTEETLALKVIAREFLAEAAHHAGGAK